MAAGAKANNTNNDTMRVVSFEPASRFFSCRVKEYIFAPTSPNKTTVPTALTNNSHEYIALNSEDSWVAELISCNDNRMRPHSMATDRPSGGFIFLEGIYTNRWKGTIEGLGKLPVVMVAEGHPFRM